jgi:hypothetical protein
MAGPQLHTVVETKEFQRQAAKRLSMRERQALIEHVAACPGAGDIVPGTGGARKVRWATAGRGKRGSVRVITFYSGADIPVFLLSVFAKGEKVDLSRAERNELRKVLGELVESYKKGVSRHVQSWGKHPPRRA